MEPAGLSAETGDRPAARSSWGRASGWSAVFLACAQLPLLAVLAQDLWRRPHYRPFPLIIAAVAFLIWRRWPRHHGTPPVRGSGVEWFLLSAAIVSLAGAVAHSCAPAAAVSGLLALGAVLLHLAGRQHLRELFPPWSVLWLLVWPLFGWDVGLIERLQMAEAGCSSLAADVLGVDHFKEGTVLSFAGRTLVVEEACSGVPSLFTLAACTALYAVSVRRPLPPSLLLLGCGVFWAGAADIFRLTTIAVAQTRWSVDLSGGWPGCVLGLAIFAAALGMIASTDAAIRFLLAPVRVSRSSAGRNGASVFWNRFVAGRQRKMGQA